MPTEIENIFGVKSGVNLIEPVNLNINPLDIPKVLYPTLGSWNVFQNYLQKNNFVRNPQFNKNQEDTNKIIAEYNNSIANPNFQKITQDAIVAAQTFHKKNDPKIQIDGWVGSQTSQLKYPNSLLIFEGKSNSEPYIPKNNKGFLPIIWGNKRFVVKAEIQSEYAKKNLFAPNSTWEQYDENIHKSTLQTNKLPQSWYTLDQNTEITKNAAQFELKRKQEEIKASTSKAITNLKFKINNI